MSLCCRLLMMLLFTTSAPVWAKNVAILIGVDTYQKPGLTPLKFAEADIREVANELKTLGFEVTTLLGTQATNQKITQTIDSTVKKLGSDDLIFVMLSGHGQQLEVKDEQGQWTESSFFCPFDAIANTPDSLVSLSAMIDQQLSPNVGRNLILVDACRDSPSESSRGIQGRVIALQEDTAILFSCRAGQRSFENAELGHGLFTYALLQALRGGAARDGKIVWSQVVSYVDWAMASEKICGYMPAPQVPISAGGVPFAVIGQGNWNEPRKDSPRPPPQPKLDSLLLNSIGMKLIKVNVGEFVMGSPASEQGHEPDELQHPIQIDNPFWMSVYEITQSEYDTVMSQSPSYFRQSGIGSEFLPSPLTDQLPVEQVSWHQAVDFCRKLNDWPAERQAKRSYRLPTEAEWEYACRSGSQTAYHFGPTFSSAAANGDSRAEFVGPATQQFIGHTVDVATYRPNAAGLYNMHGNVSEWCSDLYSDTYYLASPTASPVGPPAGQLRVIRGGSWFDGPVAQRSGDRAAADPNSKEPFTGFRVVCEVQP